MTFNVRLFAMVREIAGADIVSVSLPPEAPASMIIGELAKSYPDIERWRPHLRIAVNAEYAGEDHILREHDEIALIPPVSGG